MTRDEARLLRRGLDLSKTYLRAGQDDAVNELDQYANDEDFPALVQSFVYVGLSAAELAAGAKGVPLDRVMPDIEPRSDVTLLPCLPVGPWSAIIELASAVKQSNDGARRLAHGMDVPSAVNVSFRFAISSLSYLVHVPAFAGRTEADMVDVMREGLDQPGTVDGR
jgi:hypothetical protein